MQYTIQEYIALYKSLLYSLASRILVQDTGRFDAYLNGSGKEFFIGLDQYNQSNYIDPLIFEIEAGSVEEYVSNGKTYFILLNSEKVTAVFNDGIVVHRIWGELMVQDVKSMIDSIGGG